MTVKDEIRDLQRVDPANADEYERLRKLKMYDLVGIAIELGFNPEGHHKGDLIGRIVRVRTSRQG